MANFEKGHFGVCVRVFVCVCALLELPYFFSALAENVTCGMSGMHKDTSHARQTLNTKL